LGQINDARRMNELCSKWGGLRTLD